MNIKAFIQRHPTERRILVLPPEQAMFAGTVIGGMWSIASFVGMQFLTPHGCQARDSLHGGRDSLHEASPRSPTHLFLCYAS